MPLTEEQLKEQVLIDTAATDEIDDATLDLLWLKNDSYGLYTQYLITRVDVVNILLARNRGLVRFSGDGRSMDLQQEWDDLMQLREKFAAELSVYSSYTGEPVVCEIEATSPIMGNVGYPDPNDPYYYGSIPHVQLGYMRHYYSRASAACPPE